MLCQHDFAWDENPLSTTYALDCIENKCKRQAKGARLGVGSQITSKLSKPNHL